MFKKLYKHELASYMRKLIPIYIAIIGIALLSRIIQLLEADTLVFKLLFGSSLVGYGLSLFAAPVVVTILCIVRFYKNLFSGEGYLTFTLPVSITQHLWVKLLGAFTVQLLTFVVFLVSVPVLLDGELFVEIIKAISYLSGKAIEIVGGHFVLLIFEFVVLTLISLISGTLIIYACICIGQTAKKNRIARAVAAYFIYYAITQVISTVFSILITVLDAAGAFIPLVSMFEANPMHIIHIGFAIVLVISLILCTAYYLVCHIIMNKKLNLE